MSDEGDVLYVFPKDYRTKLATKSLRIQIEPFLEKAKVLSFVMIEQWIDLDLNVNLSSELYILCAWQGAADYLTRVSFGTALIASIVIVYTTIIVLLSSKRFSFDLNEIMLSCL